MSQSHRTLNSIAFFINPFLRFVNVTCRFRSSAMRSILIFFRPMPASERAAPQRLFHPLARFACQPPRAGHDDDETTDSFSRLERRASRLARRASRVAVSFRPRLSRRRLTSPPMISSSAPPPLRARVVQTTERVRLRAFARSRARGTRRLVVRRPRSDD